MVKRILKKLLTHRSEYYRDMLFRRVSERRLASILEEVGVVRGRILYIQSSFGSLGYYPNGAQRFIRLLQNAVGPSGTIVAPCFPFSGAMSEYVAAHSCFDARNTPSRIGLFPEVLRQHPQTRRSCHPTHSVVALGAEAEWITAGHEFTDSPQGDGSPFDKLVESNALILRMNTPAFPLCHRLQEIVDWPNLFLDAPVSLDCITDSGSAVSVTTRVYRKKLPFFMFLPGSDPKKPVPANIIDFPLISPLRVATYLRNSDLACVAERLVAQRTELQKKGEYSCVEYQGCLIDSFRAQTAMTRGVPQAQTYLASYSASYDLGQLESAYQAGTITLP